MKISCKQKGFRKQYKNCIISYHSKSEDFLLTKKHLLYNEDIGYYTNIIDAILEAEQIHKKEANEQKNGIFYVIKIIERKPPKWVLDIKEYFKHKTI